MGRLREVAALQSKLCCLTVSGDLVSIIFQNVNSVHNDFLCVSVSLTCTIPGDMHFAAMICRLKD